MTDRPATDRPATQHRTAAPDETDHVARLREEVWREAWDFHEGMHAMPVSYVSYADRNGVKA